MQNSVERAVADFFHVEVTAQRYVIQSAENVITYQITQKLNVNTVALTNFSIINAFENINRFYNQFVVSINGAQYGVFIPASLYNFWDINNLIQIVQTELTNQVPVGVWTVALGGNGNKFVTVTNSVSAFNFVYSPSVNQNQVLSYLGFGNGQQAAYNTQNLQQKAGFPYNVQVTSSINVQLQNLGFNTEVPGVVAQIPLSSPITTAIQYQSSYYQQNRHIIVKNGTMAVQNLVIALLDDLGNRMNIYDNKMSLTLLFEKYMQNG